MKTRAPFEVLTHPGLSAVCAALAQRARGHFHEAAAAMRKCARGPMKPAAAMGAVYRGYLDMLEKRGWTKIDQPVKLPKWRKLWIALRYGLF